MAYKVVGRMRFFGFVGLSLMMGCHAFIPEPLQAVVKPAYEFAQNWWETNANITLPSFDELAAGGGFPNIQDLLTRFNAQSAENVDAQGLRYPLHPGNFPTVSGAIMDTLNLRQNLRG